MKTPLHQVAQANLSLQNAGKKLFIAADAIKRAESTIEQKELLPVDFAYIDAQIERALASLAGARAIFVVLSAPGSTASPAVCSCPADAGEKGGAS